MNTLLIVCLGVVALALCVTAYIVGGRLGRAKQKIEDDLVSTTERDAAATANQQLQTDLALSRQSESQVRSQFTELFAQHALLETQVANLRGEVANQTSKLNVALATLEERNLQIASFREGNAALKAKGVADEDLIRAQQKIVGETDQLKNRLSETHAALTQKDNDLELLRSSLNHATARVAELQTELTKDREALVNERRQLEENKQVFRQEFEVLANQIFDKKQATFGEQSKQGLDLLLTPFKQQLESFRQRVDEVHTQNVQGHTGLKSELDKLRELNQRITTEATNLTRALKGDKKFQGNWGELKVELLLEQAGLVKGAEFERDKSFKNDDAENRRPDFVVKLPDSKHIIVDSKVSLVAYSEYIAAESEEAKAIALAAHILAIRNHVNSLASKNYTELVGINSPDFVFMFVAIEPAYLLAAEHSPSLFQDAYDKRITIVTATTLSPVLRVVANLWSLQRQNQSTREIVDQAAAIYDKLRVFVQKMENLGRQINTAQNSYIDTFNTLKDGRGSLIKRVERFRELGVKVKQSLPANLVDDDGAASDVEIGFLPAPGDDGESTESLAMDTDSDLSASRPDELGMLNTPSDA